MEPKARAYTFKDESRPGYWQITRVLGRDPEGVWVIVQSAKYPTTLIALMDNLKKVN